MESNDGLPEDREMPLTEHVAELRKHVVRAAIVFIAFLSIVLYFSPGLIMAFWRNTIGNVPLYTYSPLEWIVTCLTLSIVVTAIFLYPYIIYELYLFAKPGLYEHERKFLKTLLIPSYLIFLLGVFISYKFVVPAIYHFALSNTFAPYLSAEETLQNAFRMFLVTGIFFQVPLAMILADKFGIVDYKTFKNLRLPLYVIFFMIVTNVSMDITGITQIASVLIFAAMFETGLLFLKIKKKLFDRSPSVRSPD